MTAQQLQKIEPQESRAITPMDMLDKAIASGNIEVIGKIMEFQERWEANEARKAFNNAMADARAKIKPIVKNRHVGFDAKNGGARTDYDYEDMAGIAAAVDPILAEFGLSYRYRTQNSPNEPVAVTCIISHRQGHSEETTLRGPPDNSGNKNSIQAVGSTVTFLQRYTLKAALGLSAAKDDDAKGADDQSQQYITPEQVAELEELLEDEVQKKRFLAFIKVEGLENIFANKFEAAKSIIESKRKK